MRILTFLLAFMASSFPAFAQVAEAEEETSPIVYILIGVIVIGLIVYMLQKRQKRKFNE